MQQRSLYFLFLLLLLGCNASYSERPLSTDHPANPDAAAAAPESHSRLLALDNVEPVMPAQSAPDDDSTGEVSGMQHERSNPGTFKEDSDASLSPRALYVCPMHPDMTSTKPDQWCPKCGKKLVLKKGEEE